jgi:NAD-dependent SIR2 family protein deacetylase
MEQAGACAGLITQNVDGLHHVAGSKRVVELHGALAKVCCTDCKRIVDRRSYQEALVACNPEWSGFVNEHISSAPDGDAELPTSYITSFVVPACAECGGVMKPDVVFFGENVPRARVDEAWSIFAEGDVLLVVGSSLTVYSGRRFTIAAAQRGIPIALVNLGPTRADDVATVKLDAKLGEALPVIAQALAGRAA